MKEIISKALHFLGKGQLITALMLTMGVAGFFGSRYMLVWMDNFNIQFKQQQIENTEIKNDITKIKETQIRQTNSQEDIMEQLGLVGRKVDKNRDAVVRQIEKSNLSTEEKINEVKNLYSTDNEKKNYVSGSSLTQLK